MVRGAIMSGHHQSSNALFRGAETGLAVLPRNHNGGPPLDDHIREWGPNGIGQYFVWKQAFQDAWKPVSRETALRRLKKADACGLTYREYTLVLLETGRHLQPEDREIIAKIVARR